SRSRLSSIWCSSMAQGKPRSLRSCSRVALGWAGIEEFDLGSTGRGVVRWGEATDEPARKDARPTEWRANLRRARLTQQMRHGTEFIIFSGTTPQGQRL